MSDSLPPHLRLFVERPPWYQHEVSDSTSFSDDDRQVLRLKIRMRVLEGLLEETKEHIRELGGDAEEQTAPLSRSTSHV